MSTTPSAVAGSYSPGKLVGAEMLGAVGIITLLSIIIFVVSGALRRTKSYSKTHINGHFHALLLANALQGISSVMNFEWVSKKAVIPGHICSVQAGIKQAGNVGTAIISLSISVHLFSLLFLRRSIRQVYFYTLLTGLWAIVAIIVIVGPLVIEKSGRGPYFGIAGTWCWITAEYPKSRFYLEYFLEFLSAGCCLIIYIVLYLRVRGNLTKTGNGWWHFSFQPDDWEVMLSRDILDFSMLNVVKSMIWFPVVYALVITPIAVARLTEFSGGRVPYAATIFCSSLFNLTGFFNVILLFRTVKYFPEAETIPTFSTQREHLRVSMATTGGLMPFTLQKSESAEEYQREKQKRHLKRISESSTSSEAQLLGQLGSRETTPATSPVLLSDPSREMISSA